MCNNLFRQIFLLEVDILFLSFFFFFNLSTPSLWLKILKIAIKRQVC